MPSEELQQLWKQTLEALKTGDLDLAEKLRDQVLELDPDGTELADSIRENCEWDDGDDEEFLDEIQNTEE